MEIFTKSADLKQFISQKKLIGKSIGFVPTMGALHQGHASLVEKSKLNSQISVVSIFVNPTQFNNEEDFLNYPIKTEQDLILLNGCSVDAVFIPDKDEIYTNNLIVPAVDLGELNQIMEGAFRSGHFEGVVNVVYRLFKIVEPNKAYFGLKDFQQVAVIKQMTKQLDLDIEIIPCPTIREHDGLAMSSRNLRLSNAQRKDALFIFQQLNNIQQASKDHSPLLAKSMVVKAFKNSLLKLEYIEIIDSETFESLESQWSDSSIACIAAYCGEIRLIDNIKIN